MPFSNPPSRDLKTFKTCQRHSQEGKWSDALTSGRYKIDKRLYLHDLLECGQTRNGRVQQMQQVLLQIMHWRLEEN